jgi:hypothetical protein
MLTKRCAQILVSLPLIFYDNLCQRLAFVPFVLFFVFFVLKNCVALCFSEKIVKIHVILQLPAKCTPTTFLPPADAHKACHKQWR